MVSTEELMPILKKILENQEKLTQEIEELRSKNETLTTKHKQALLHAMSPKDKAEYEKEELLSSSVIEKCVDLIIRDAKRSPRFR